MTLIDVIKKLRPGHIGNNHTYVAKNYTVADLVRDLQDIQNEIILVDLERDVLNPDDSSHP